MSSDLSNRTKQFAIKIVRFYIALPKSTEFQVLGKQVIRSGTSVGAHYREAKRARSDAEFISKMEVGLQELEETQYWLELLQELSQDAHLDLGGSPLTLLAEARELTAIFTTCVKNAKQKKSQR